MVKKSMPKKHKVPSKNQPIFKIVGGFFKLFIFRNIKVTYLCSKEEIPNKCIMVSNHSAKNGPMALELYLPIFNVKWGAHQMLGNYSSRFHYLRDVFYIQKCGWGKFKATIKAGIEALFSKMLYKGMKFVPTYPDGRLTQTIKQSIEILDDDKAILVFPEDSNEGYKEIMTSFFSGFVLLSLQYFKKTGEDLPIYPIYYHQKKKIIIVGKPLFVQELVNKGMNRDQIAELFCEEVNNLFLNNIK